MTAQSPFVSSLNETAKDALVQRPIRCGILGTGGFAGYRRATLRRSGVFRLEACVEPLDGRFSQAQREEAHPLKRYASAEEIAADPSLEAIFISTPASLHLAQAWPIVKAGKAIFIEKPLGHDWDDCQRLVEYCEAEQIPHGHGFSAPFVPLWVEVNRLIQSGALGKIISVSATSMHSGGLTFAEDNWRFDRTTNPGGPLFQCGIHKIDLLRRMFGEGHWVAGLVNASVTASETDDSYVLLGSFGGIPVTLHSHYVTSYRHSMEVYGTKANLMVGEHPQSLAIKRTNLAGGAEPLEDLTDTLGESDTELHSLQNFAHAVRQRKQPAMSGREGLRTLKLVFDAVAIAQPTSLPLRMGAPIAELAAVH